ncbi:hypothetical protein KAT80_03290 [Candidatus Pacearchaeota archaeon]|nr:hypothetical protein [Candidatus Pacearchaeota archaeon]
MTSEQDIKKIREMMEFLVKQKIVEKIKKLNETERKIYGLTEGKGQAEIINLLKVSSKTISKVWQKLESEGLFIKEGTKYRKVV